MAKICSQCGYENADNEIFCMGCNAPLEDAAEVADNKKGKRIKQEQNPVARRMLAIVLIAATLLCLITTFQYFIGIHWTKVIFPPNLEYEYNFRDLDHFFAHMSEFPHTHTKISSSWESVWRLWKDAKRVDLPTFIEACFVNDNYFYHISIILSQCCNTVAYLFATILTAVATLLVICKSPKARNFALIAAILGVVIIIFGCLIGYLFVRYDYSHFLATGEYFQKAYEVPPGNVWLLLPLFSFTCPLAFMLSKNIKD